MKKFSLYALLGLMGVCMSSCEEDYTDWSAPQTNPQEEAVVVPGISASAAADVDLNSYTENLVPVFNLAEIALPEGMSIENARIKVAPADLTGAEVTEVAVALQGNQGVVSVEELQSLVHKYYGKRPEVRRLTAQAYLNAMDNGQAVLVDAGTFTIVATPKAPVIAQNYYVVGGTLDWAGSCSSKAQKFSHSGKDVYEDPIFTITIPASADGDTWFAIGDDAACDAVVGGDWSQLYGTTSGNGNNGETGSLARRSELADDGSFCVAKGCKAIKIEINMLECTYKITPRMEDISKHYYLIGAPSEWQPNCTTMPFQHSGKDVYEDPIFTVVFPVADGETWFAVSDDVTVEKNDWKYVFGCVEGNGNNGMEGSLARRSELADDGSWKITVDGDAKFVKMTLNMKEYTYKLEKLNFAEYYYEIGNESGWSTSHALYGPNSDGKYFGYYYLNGEFKFKPNEGDWNGDLERNGGDDALSGILSEQGAGNCPDPGAAFYRIDLDAAGLTYKLTAVTSISIIGTVNGNWDTDTDLTYNTNTGAWEYTGALNAGEMKFRMNHDWAISWGGDATNLTEFNGANITLAEGGNYAIQLFISHEGKNYCTITKQ